MPKRVVLSPSQMLEDVEESRRQILKSIGAVAGLLIAPAAFGRQSRRHAGAKTTHDTSRHHRAAVREAPRRLHADPHSRRVADSYNAQHALGPTDRRISRFGGTHKAAEKVLSIYNTHTGESVSTTYWVKGRYRLMALREVSYVMRDHHNNQVHSIDPQLLDLLHELQSRSGRCDAFHVMSAYRSPETNARLGRRNHAVAEHSMHLEGKAVDLWLPGCALSDLHRIAVDLRGGGVGYYPRSNFVHIDTGKIRYWGA